MKRNLKLTILVYYLLFFASSIYVYNLRSNARPKYISANYSNNEFIEPTNFAAHNNGYLVSSRTGLIYSVIAQEKKVVLDLTDDVYYEKFLSEDGLFTIKLHPEFESNGFLFVFYTRVNDTRVLGALDTSPPLDTIISRFTIVGNAIDRTSEVIILNLPLFGPYHRAGGLEFDKQGMLLASIGDDWNPTESQNLSSLYGKIIRIDVDNIENGKSYSIPEDNPFKGTANESIRQEIWAYGLRNPYRFAYSDDILFAADVGLNDYEEINIIQPGKNYGWRIYEGLQYNPTYENISSREFEEPFIVYPHPSNRPISYYKNDPSGIAVISGHIYQGKNFPELKGKFIFSDYLGSTWAVTFDSNYQVVETQKLVKFPDNILDISVDLDGELVFAGEGTDTLYMLSLPLPVKIKSLDIFFLILPILVVVIKKNVVDRFWGTN